MKTNKNRPNIKTDCKILLLIDKSIPKKNIENIGTMSN
jgi:hypothetical protein